MEVWLSLDSKRPWADRAKGQVKDTDDGRPTGFDDTICPVDFPENGQITSDQVRQCPRAWSCEENQRH